MKNPSIAAIVNKIPSDKTKKFYVFKSGHSALEDCIEMLENKKEFFKSVSSIYSEIKLNEKQSLELRAKISEKCSSKSISPELLSKLGFQTEILFEHILKMPDELKGPLQREVEGWRVKKAIKEELERIKSLSKKQEDARLAVFKMESTEEQRQKEALRDAVSKARASHESLKLSFGHAWIPFRVEGIELAQGLTRLHKLLGSSEVVSSAEVAEIVFEYFFELKPGQRPADELRIVLETKNELIAQGVKSVDNVQYELSQIREWLIGLERKGLIGAYLKWASNTAEISEKLFGEKSPDTLRMTRALRGFLKINESLKRINSMPLIRKCTKLCATESQLLEVLNQLSDIKQLTLANVEVLPTEPEQQAAWSKIIEEFPLKYGNLMTHSDVLIKTLGWTVPTIDQIGMALEKSKTMLNPNTPWVGAASEELVRLRKELVEIEFEMLEAKSKSYLITLFGTDIVENPEWLDALNSFFDLSEQAGLETEMAMELLAPNRIYELIELLEAREQASQKNNRTLKLYAQLGKNFPQWEKLGREDIKKQIELLTEEIKKLEQLTQQPELPTPEKLSQVLAGSFELIVVEH